MAARVDPVSESESEGSGASWRLRLAWKLGKRVLNWIKALSSLVFLVVSGLADQYNVADIAGFVRGVFADSTKLALYVIVASAAFVALQQLVKLPKGFSASKNLDDGE